VRKRERVAFTVIELLVVIAIIALLISILVPSLTLAKPMARTAVRGSNLHHMSLAVGYYVSDYDEYLFATALYVNGQFSDSTVGLTRLGYFGDAGGQDWRHTDSDYVRNIMRIMKGHTLCPSYPSKSGQERKWVVDNRASCFPRWVATPPRERKRGRALRAESSATATRSLSRQAGVGS